MKVLSQGFIRCKNAKRIKLQSRNWLNESLILWFRDHWTDRGDPIST